MKSTRLLQLLSILATLDFTVASPLGTRNHSDEVYHNNVVKWDKGKYLATEVINLITVIGKDHYPWYRGHTKLTRDDFIDLIERYFGIGSHPAFKQVLVPMFARMQEGLKLGHAGPLKYRYDHGNEGFSGSAYTIQEVINFANQGLLHHPFVDTVRERARVWIHEMTHLAWVNGGLGDTGVRDIPTNAIEYSTHDLERAQKPLRSIYGETLGQYLAYCYPNAAPFNTDNVARFAMAVFETSQSGHKPGAAHFAHKCPAGLGEHPVFDMRQLPYISPEIGGPSYSNDDDNTSEKVSVPYRTLYHSVTTTST